MKFRMNGMENIVKELILDTKEGSTGPNRRVTQPGRFEFFYGQYLPCTVYPNKTFEVNEKNLFAFDCHIADRKKFLRIMGSYEIVLEEMGYRETD